MKTILTHTVLIQNKNTLKPHNTNSTYIAQQESQKAELLLLDCWTATIVHVYYNTLDGRRQQMIEHAIRQPFLAVRIITQYLYYCGYNHTPLLL